MKVHANIVCVEVLPNGDLKRFQRFQRGTSPFRVCNEHEY